MEEDLPNSRFLIDWNPHPQSYEWNERLILDFEGSISEPSLRLKHQVVFEEEDNKMTDFVTTMASVSASDRESNIDANVSTEFSVPPSVE